MAAGQRVGASAPLREGRSRWSLNFVRNSTVFEVSSTASTLSLWVARFACPTVLPALLGTPAVAPK